MTTAPEHDHVQCVPKGRPTPTFAQAAQGCSLGCSSLSCGRVHKGPHKQHDLRSEWRNGPLPSVKQLQQEHDVGRDTILRAVEILRDEGLVFTVPRRGTYVSPDTK